MAKKNGKEKVMQKEEKRIYSAEERVQAVLSVWSERRRPSEICKELSIKWAVLNHWQDRALRGMMTALQPRSRKPMEKSPALGPKLERLLQRVSRQAGKSPVLEKRLKKIQSETKAT
jgi:transposase-like protein